MTQLQPCVPLDHNYSRDATHGLGQILRLSLATQALKWLTAL
jgi:hypothetical protein